MGVLCRWFLAPTTFFYYTRKKLTENKKNKKPRQNELLN